MSEIPSKPINRKEAYLAAIAGQEVEVPAKPITREEAYLNAILENGTGGGGGGTTNYNQLSNKPQINSVELSGNKTLSDLGIASASELANKVDKVAGKDLSSNDYSDTEKQKNADNATAISAIKDGATIDSFADVESALSNKQDTLTFDDAPTDGSNNPVKSNGVYDALELKQNATDNSLDTDAKTIVGAINEHEGDISSLKSGLTNLSKDVLSKHASLTSNKWYKIAEKTIATPIYYIRHICLSVAGTSIKHVQIRCVPTDGFNNNNNLIEQFAGTQQAVALKVSTDGKTIEIFIKGTSTGGARYSVLSEAGESGTLTFTDPVETEYTTEDMTIVN